MIDELQEILDKITQSSNHQSMWARGKEEMKSLHKFSKLSKTEASSIIYDYYLDYWNNRRICSTIRGLPPMIKRGAYYERLEDLAA